MMDTPAASPAPAIEMRAVDVSSMSDPERVTVRGVNWTVQPGEFWAIGGLQGSGKSDFLFLAGGLIAPAAGTYAFFGQPMPIFQDERLTQRLRLGLVFEGGQLFNHLTVRENIALPLRYHRDLAKPEAEAEVRSVLDHFELGPWADSTPGAIGRSWQKRAGLARALILRPEVLLIDNPLGGLDPRHARWWLRFLDALAAGHPLTDGRPVTLAITTADLGPWRGHARQLAVLRDDRFSVLSGWPAPGETGAELTAELWPGPEAAG